MSSLWILLLVSALTLALFKLFRANKLNKNGKIYVKIPEPRSLPLLGNAVQLLLTFWRRHTYPLSHFAQKYGEIYRIKVPFDEIVVLASHASITEVLSQEGAMGRECSGIMIDRSLGGNLGIATTYGVMWKKTRGWTFRNLRNFGFGKTSEMEISVNVEVLEYLRELQEKEDTSNHSLILPVSQTFLLSIGTMMYKMIAGKDSKVNKETLEELNETTAKFEEAFSFYSNPGAPLVVCLPWLRFLFPGLTGRTALINCRNAMQKESKRLRDAARQKMCQPNAAPESWTEMWVQEMIRKEEETLAREDLDIFTELNYDAVFLDLYQGSTTTTSSYLEALVLFSILYPEVQEKMWAEICDTVPSGQELIYKDKARMVYTSAVFLETHRFANIFQNYLPRRALADIEYKNYRIKKGSLLIAEMNKVFRDPELFEDPLFFKPERFIDSNGKLVNTGLVIAFSVGSRNCPGQLFADVATFLMFVNILRKYKLSIVPGTERPSEEMKVALISAPYPFSVLMNKRTNKELEN